MKLFRLTTTSAILSPVVAPDILVPERSITVIDGSMAMLTCLAMGDPDPVQSWSRNGSPLTSGGRYQISGNGSVLTVQQVNEAQDEGVFTCHASNSAGSDSDTVTLSVQGIQRHLYFLTMLQ